MEQDSRYFYQITNPTFKRNTSAKLSFHYHALYEYIEKMLLATIKIIVLVIQVDLQFVIPRCTLLQRTSDDTLISHSTTVTLRIAFSPLTWHLQPKT